MKYDKAMLFFKTTSSGNENNLLAPGARSLFQSTLAGNPEDKYKM